MGLRRIIKIKEGIKEARARELREVEMQISYLKREIESIERIQEEINLTIKTSFSEGLLFQYRSLMSKKKDLLKRLSQLEAIREEKKHRLKEAYRDVKALEILKEVWDKNQRSREASLEAQRSGFLHLIKRWRRDV